MKIKFAKTDIITNQATIGERIELKVERMIANKEPIEAGTKPIYIPRADGVPPEYDIRTDKFEIAAAASDKVHKGMIDLRGKSGMPPLSGGAEPIHGTEQS